MSKPKITILPSTKNIICIGARVCATDGDTQTLSLMKANIDTNRADISLVFPLVW